MASNFRRVKAKRIQAELTDGKKKWDIIHGPIEDVLSDNNISWEAKGYLSGLMFTQDTIYFPKNISDELIKFGYMMEVAE